MEAPIRARYADEIARFEVVDEILRTGSNCSKGQLRLIYNFMVEKTTEEYTEFVKNEYGTEEKALKLTAQSMRSGSMIWGCALRQVIRQGRVRLSMRFCHGRM